MIPDDLSPIGTCAAIGAARGLHVFPCHSPVGASWDACSCRRAECRNRAKHPRTEHGLDDATVDLEQIRSWWRKWPDANIGVSCGPSGLYVVDTDGEEAEDAWQMLRAERDPFDTTMVQTSRGWHYWFTVPADSTLGNTASRIAPGIDTRGQGGYVFLPPSKHISGHVYRFETPLPPVPLPDWVAELVRPKPEPARERSTVARAIPAAQTGGRLSRYAYKALETEIQGLLDATAGARNHTLNRAAFNLGQLVGAGLLPEQEVRDALYAAGEAIGLTDHEMVGATGNGGTINSGLNKGMRSPRQVSA